jgi:arylsulfatase
MSPDVPNASRPNIILIMVDDMGFSDIGPYGSEIATPNLDGLAGGGVRFSRMYNCARCCPTRASILTGLYPHQAGVGHMVGNRGLPGYQGHINDNCVTIAEALKTAGYRTLMSGKWHCGGNYAPHRPETWTPGDAGHPLPVQRGFDEHYGTLGGAGSFFKPPTLIHNDTFIEPEGENYYYTDAISENASRMIRQAHADGQPFFCYVAYTAPHWPLHALPEDIEKYRGRYARGWDPLRTSRHEELKSSGILSDRWEISPRDPHSPGFDELDAKRREWEDLRMAVYAAMIDRMDQGVGHILATLDELGVADDTLVMFLSDNGGCAEYLREDGGNVERYDIPTRDGRPMKCGNRPDLEPGPADTFMSYDLPWANASNSPFRLYKSYTHEGGISTPLVARWPKKFAGGHLSHRIGHVVDIMATCLEAAGAEYPEQYDGRQITPLEGESLLPAMCGEDRPRTRPVFWEHQGSRAVRDGDWKLVYQRGQQCWELYDMNVDRTELNDLAPKDTQRAARMTEMYEQWAKRCGVVPFETL